MNSLARKHYETGGFTEVLFLSEQKDPNWDPLSEKIPDLPRAWFELSQIPSKARIEFISNLWMDTLTYETKATRSMLRFFSLLEDIEIVLCTQNFMTSVEMVYSLRDNCSFFRGGPPLNEQDIRMYKLEVGANLPEDYFSFFRLHNGFGKLGEEGIFPVDARERAKEDVFKLLQNQRNFSERLIWPEMLIPFYESMGSFQCFFSDWYPNSEMGNVFLSGINYTESDTTNPLNWERECAFPSFQEWLSRYLEGLSISR